MKRYSFNALIEILEVRPSFIKRLEEAEVILPMREGKNTYYTEREIRKLLLAKELKEMGINLAGIEVILEMRENMLAIRKEADDILCNLLKYIDQNIRKEIKEMKNP